MLPACLISLAGQTKPPAVIVMDGGSTDGTVDCLKEWDSTIQFWESRPDRGIAHAWNKALLHVKTSWVIFLGADDKMAGAHVVERATEQLQSGSARLVHGRAKYESGGWSGISMGREGAAANIRRRMSVPHAAVFHHRSLFDEVGHFDESYKIALDYHFLLRALKVASLESMDLDVALLGSGGISSRERQKSLQEATRAKISTGTVNPASAYSWKWYCEGRALLERTIRRSAGRDFSDARSDAQ